MQKQNNVRMSRTELLAVAVVAVATFSVFLALAFNLDFIPLASAAYNSPSNVVATANVLSICFTVLTPNGLNGYQVITPANVANDLVFGGGVFGGGTNGISPTFSVPTSVQLIDNDIGGNANANVLIAGSNWFQVTNSANTFYEYGNILWNPVTLGTFSGNDLNLYNGQSASLGATNIFITAPAVPSPTNGVAANIFFGLQIPFGQQLGIYYENIVVENSC